MGLKQASLFDFESTPPSGHESREGRVQPIPVTEKNTEKLGEPVKEEIIIDEEAREVEVNVTVQPRVSASPPGKSTRGRMKLSDMDSLAGLVEIPADDELFSRRYYTIGTVSEMFRVNVSLIRFWENEFDILKPKKNGKGDRLFRPEDIKNLQIIYNLLREKKYTIEGAKDFIRNNKKVEENYALIDSLKKLKSFLLELKATI